MPSRKKAPRTEVHRVTAFREAGHAVVAWDLQIMLKPLSIFPNGRGVGRNAWNDALRNVDFDWVAGADSSSLAERLATVMLAGPVAESAFAADSAPGDISFKRRRDAGTLLGAALGGREEGARRFERIEGELSGFFERSDVRRTVEALATALLEQGRLSGDDVAGVIAGNMSRGRHSAGTNA